jgi:hypothetical protein
MNQKRENGQVGDVHAGSHRARPEARAPQDLGELVPEGASARVVTQQPEPGDGDQEERGSISIRSWAMGWPTDRENPVARCRGEACRPLAKHRGEDQGEASERMRRSCRYSGRASGRTAFRSRPGACCVVIRAVSGSVSEGIVDLIGSAAKWPGWVAGAGSRSGVRRRGDAAPRRSRFARTA